MKTKISCLIIAFSASMCYKAYSQLTIPQLGNAQCPGVALPHTVINPVNAACVYDWVVTNGTIQGGTQSGSTSTLNNAGTTVTITWSSSSTSGSINVTAKSCSPAPGNASITLTAPILSLNGVNPGAVTGSPGATAVQINSTPNLVFTVPQIQYPNRGSLDPNPYNVTTYEWQIPSGWTVVSGGTSNTITVRPDNCSAGNMRVRGKASCSNGNFFSNWSSSLAITRTLGNPAAITGSSSVNCTDVSTKTYSISAVPGATSYTWALPSGWTGTSTTTSITVTPSGTTGGNITVRANGCSLQSSPSTLSIQLNQFDPANNPYVASNLVGALCEVGNTYFLINQPPNTTVTWQATPSNLLVTGSGTGTSAFLQAANNFVNGQGTITFTIVGPCGTITRNLTFWVGRVQSQAASGIYITGNATPTPFFTYGYGLSSVPTGQGPITYRWQIPSGSYWNITFDAGYYISAQVGTNAGSIEGFWQNNCGTETGTYLYVVPNAGGGGGEPESIYPNPASESLTVQFGDENEKRVKLINSESVTIFETTETAKTMTMPINNLKEGTYYLIINDGKTTKKERVVIKR